MNFSKKALFISLTLSFLTLLKILWPWTLSQHCLQRNHPERQLLSPVSVSGLDMRERINGNCSDKVCTGYLTERDYSYFNQCIKDTWTVPPEKYPEAEEFVCRFMNGTGRDPVGLAGYQGSGNTWVRGLLQKVTGICTGAVYCDIALRQNGFPGENVRSGTVLVVKTHQADPRWSGVYYDKDLPVAFFKKPEDSPLLSAAIYLLRNPFDAIVAEYNRQTNVNTSIDNHILQNGPEEFGT